MPRRCLSADLAAQGVISHRIQIARTSRHRTRRRVEKWPAVTELNQGAETSVIDVSASKPRRKTPPKTRGGGRLYAGEPRRWRAQRRRLQHGEQRVIHSVRQGSLGRILGHLSVPTTPRLFNGGELETDRTRRQLGKPFRKEPD